MRSSIGVRPQNCRTSSFRGSAYTFLLFVFSILLFFYSFSLRLFGRNIAFLLWVISILFLFRSEEDSGRRKEFKESDLEEDGLAFHLPFLGFRFAWRRRNLGGQKEKRKKKKGLRTDRLQTLRVSQEKDFMLGGEGGRRHFKPRDMEVCSFFGLAWYIQYMALCVALDFGRRLRAAASGGACHLCKSELTYRRTANKKGGSQPPFVFPYVYTQSSWKGGNKSIEAEGAITAALPSSFCKKGGFLRFALITDADLQTVWRTDGGRNGFYLRNTHFLLSPSDCGKGGVGWKSVSRSKVENEKRLGEEGGQPKGKGVLSDAREGIRNGLPLQTNPLSPNLEKRSGSFFESDVLNWRPEFLQI